MSVHRTTLKSAFHLVWLSERVARSKTLFKEKTVKNAGSLPKGTWKTPQNQLIRIEGVISFTWGALLNWETRTYVGMAQSNPRPQAKRESVV